MSSPPPPSHHRLRRPPEARVADWTDLLISGGYVRDIRIVYAGGQLQWNLLALSAWSRVFASYAAEVGPSLCQDCDGAEAVAIMPDVQYEELKKVMAWSCGQEVVLSAEEKQLFIQLLLCLGLKVALEETPVKADGVAKAAVDVKTETEEHESFGLGSIRVEDVKSLDPAAQVEEDKGATPENGAKQQVDEAVKKEDPGAQGPTAPPIIGKDFSCMMCKFMAHDTKSLRVHLAHTHFKTSLIQFCLSALPKCVVCKEQTDTLEKTIDHIAADHTDVILELFPDNISEALRVMEADEHFQNEADLNADVASSMGLAPSRIPTNGVYYACSLCKYFHPSSHVMRQHMCLKHFRRQILEMFGAVGTTVCTMCMKDFRTSANLARHLGIVHRGETIVGAPIYEHKAENVQSLVVSLENDVKMEEPKSEIGELGEGEVVSGNGDAALTNSLAQPDVPVNVVATLPLATPTTAQVRQTRKWAGVVEEFVGPCKTCHKGFGNQAILVNHLCQLHFANDLINLNLLGSDGQCQLCGQPLHSRGELVKHVGQLHGRILEVVPPGLKDLLLSIARLLVRRYEASGGVRLQMRQQQRQHNRAIAPRSNATTSQTVSRSLQALPTASTSNRTIIVSNEAPATVPATAPATMPATEPVASTSSGITRVWTTKNWAGEMERFVGECGVCRQGFDLPSNLVGHLSMVHFSQQLNLACRGARSDQCPLCNTHFSGRYLAQHLGYSHGRILDVVQPELRAFLVQICPRLEKSLNDCRKNECFQNVLVENQTEQVFVMENNGEVEYVGGDDSRGRVVRNDEVVISVVAPAEPEVIDID